MKKTITLAILGFLLIIPLSFAQTNLENQTNNNLGNTNLESSQELEQFENQIHINATAQINVEISNNESQIINIESGAQIKLLQLSNRLEIQIENANSIILNIQKEDTNFNTQRLEEIVEEFKEVKNEIDNQNLQNNNTQTLANFIILKDKSIKLTKEFKNITKKFSTEEKRKTIREQNKNQLQKKIKNLNQNQEFKKLKNNFYISFYTEFLNSGLTNESQIYELSQGNIDFKEFKTNIKNKINNLTKEEKKQTINKIKQKQKIKLEKNQKNKEKISNYIDTNKEKLRKLTKNEIRKLTKNSQKELKNKIKDLKKNIHVNDIKKAKKSITENKEIKEKLKQEILKNPELLNEKILEILKKNLSEEELTELKKIQEEIKNEN